MIDRLQGVTCTEKEVALPAIPVDDQSGLELWTASGGECGRRQRLEVQMQVDDWRK